MILKKTPTVDFDPTNAEHRAAVAAFMKRTAWCDAKFRFTYDPEFGSVADQVKARMLAWYIAQDTHVVVKRPARKRVKKTVNDNATQ